MNVTKKVEKKINRMQEGTTFKYQQLDIAAEEYSAAAKAIERLIAKEVIKRISTGVFYKPKKTAFGELMPRETEILKPYLFVNNKRIAYISGTTLYNRMGLTTQVPKNVKVASREKRITTRVGNMQVKPVKSYVDVTNDNYYLLELLDVLKDLKKIPDLDKTKAINYLLNIIKELKEKDQSRLIKLALQYPPRVRAFLGALLIKLKSKQPIINSLKQSLNPLTTYDYGIGKEMLTTASNWNIK